MELSTSAAYLESSRNEGLAIVRHFENQLFDASYRWNPKTGEFDPIPAHEIAWDIAQIMFNYQQCQADHWERHQQRMNFVVEHTIN